MVRAATSPTTRSKVSHLTAIDPLEELWRKRRIDLSKLGFDVNYLKGSAEEIPAEDGSFDTVVSTFTLCSVDDIDKVLEEIHRVLKPEENLSFLNMGNLPKQRTARWQNMLNPALETYQRGMQSEPRYSGHDEKKWIQNRPY